MVDKMGGRGYVVRACRPISTTQKNVMQRESGKIFLACALGAGIGSLVALELAAAFWWVGLLVGGAVGYLSYEWREVRAAVPKALAAARGWRSPPTYWKDVKSMCAVSVCIVSWALPAAAIGLWAYSYVDDLSLIHIVVKLAISTMVVMAAIAILAGLGLFLVSPIIALNGDEGFTISPRDILRRGFSPIVLFWDVPRNIPSVPRLLGRFLRELFLRIHSQERLICGVDALLGALVGTYAGSAIVGALVGGVLGVVNYELVTLRWLVPRGYVTIKR